MSDTCIYMHVCVYMVHSLFSFLLEKSDLSVSDCVCVYMVCMCCVYGGVYMCIQCVVYSHSY